MKLRISIIALGVSLLVNSGCSTVKTAYIGNEQSHFTNPAKIAAMNAQEQGLELRLLDLEDGADCCEGALEGLLRKAKSETTEQSYKEYTKAVELQPADADAKLGLAKTLIEMNQTDKALALLEDAVRLEPTNATAHYRLATLYRKMGRADDAKREMELYKKFKEMKEKLTALYKELQVQPKEIRADEQDEQ